MKSAIALALVALLGGCAMPPLPPPLEIVTVHEAPGRNQREICNAARDWTALTFKDSKAVIEVFDPEQGKLIGKGRVPVIFVIDPASAEFTFIVECKDGKARSTFTSFLAWHKGSSFLLMDSGLNSMRSQTVAKVEQLKGDLGNYLKNPKVGADW